MTKCAAPRWCHPLARLLARWISTSRLLRPAQLTWPATAAGADLVQLGFVEVCCKALPGLPSSQCSILYDRHASYPIPYLQSQLTSSLYMAAYQSLQTYTSACSRYSRKRNSAQQCTLECFTCQAQIVQDVQLAVTNALLKPRDAVHVPRDDYLVLQPCTPSAKPC